MSWFEVGFSWFQVSFYGFHGSRPVFMIPGWFFMVIHGSWSIFHDSRSVSMVTIFPVPFFMIPGFVLWFFMVPGWFISELNAGGAK